MRKILAVTSSLAFLLLLPSCSPRDFLTRRLAADLIRGADAFRAQQRFQFRTGVISDHDYLSADYLVLQHRGWISGAKTACPRDFAPPPCWDVMLTPSGVDTFQTLIAPGNADKQSFSIPAVRRELVAITGIAKQANVADIEFTWRWTPVNEVGAALYPGGVRFRSTAMLRKYDDGWRIVQTASRPGQPLDEALKDAQPAQ